MKILIKLIVLFILFSQKAEAQDTTLRYKRLWSTYYGFSFTHMGIDGDKNLIITGNGGFSEGYFPEYFNQYITMGGSAEGSIITKFTPEGNRVWAFLFPLQIQDLYIPQNTSDNAFYVVGNTLTNNEPNFATQYAWLSEKSRNYLAKFSTNGELLMFTYLPFSVLSVCADNDHVYVGGTSDTVIANIEIGTSGSFQPNMLSQNQNQSIIMSFNTEGEKVWGTFYGYSQVWDLEIKNQSLYVSLSQYASDSALSPNYYSSANAFLTGDSVINQTSLLVQLNSQNGQRIWATYLTKGGLSAGYKIAIGDNRNVFLAGDTYDSEGVGTPGTFLSETDASNGDFYVNCFSPEGDKIWGTYLGAKNGYTYTNPFATFNYISTRSDKIVFSGATDKTVFVTDSCEQPIKNGGYDALVRVLDANTGKGLYGSYFGGEKNDYAVFANAESDTSFYLYGSTRSQHNITTPNSFQFLFSVPPDSTVTHFEDENGFIAKFILDTAGRLLPDTTTNNPDTTINNPDTTINNPDTTVVNPIPQLDSVELVLYPNPNNGAFYFAGWPLTKAKYEMVFYDAAGRQLAYFKLSQAPLQYFNFAKAYPAGIYFARLINTASKQSHTYKVLKK